MPEDAVAYVELNRPGELLERLAAMVGLTGKDMQEVLAQRPGTESKAPFHIPQEIVISPSVFEVLRGFGGVAAAVTSFDPSGGRPPSGVLVMHHGDVTLLKGLLETAFQFSPTAEKVGGLPTFAFDVPEVGRITGVLTECLLIVGTGRELVEGAVGRLMGGGKSSLGSRDDLVEFAGAQRGATLFGYVNLQQALKIARASMDEDDLREFAMANALGDLDSLRSATVSFGVHDGALGARLSLRLAEDHRSFIYNLFCLPSMGRKCLEKVPADAAALVGLGLNPALAGAAVDAAQRRKPQAAISAFDIGRELFGNIQELCAFVIPGKMASSDSEDGPSHIPNAGLILAVNDTARSRALWNQMLSIPGVVGGDKPAPPRELKIGSTDVTSYTIPSFGKVYLAELDGCIAVGATRAALKACIRAHEKGDSVVKDAVMSRALARLPADSSLMAVVHVGRLADVAAGTGDAGMAMVATQASQLCAQTVAWAGLGQSPTRMTLQWAVTGLPDVNEALKKYGPMLNAFAGMGARKAPRETVTEAQAEPKKVVKKARKASRGEPL
jgi:hypothetical protein